MSILTKIVAVSFAVFPILSHQLENPTSEISESGMWVSTCLGSVIFIDFSDNDTPPQEFPVSDPHACHATCRENHESVLVSTSKFPTPDKD